MAEPHGSDVPVASESRAVTATLWVLVVVLHAVTAGMLVLLGGIVLFEEGAVGPAPRNVAATIALCVSAMLGVNLVFPWLLSFDPRARAWRWRSPVGLHLMIAICGVLSMFLYLLVMEPVGGRRDALNLVLPAVLLPIGYLLSWRAFQIGAESVGRPARDVSEWTALDHLLGRRRRS